MNENRKRFKDRLKEINSLTGYTAGESAKHVARGSGLDPSKILKLNANENFWIPKDKLDFFLREVLEDVDPRLYPQEEEADLKWALGKYLNTPPESIIIGSGSDPLLAFITQLFIGRGEQAFSISPTWSLYQLLVKLRGAKYFEIPLKNDFSIDIEKILVNTSEARMFFLCSPNNPTANQFEEEKVLALVKNFPGLVVIDEAYGEFANYSAVHLVKNYKNLIVTRTFSKIGLAALRLGYMVSNHNLSKILFKKAQLPYPVNSITLKMGIKLLANIKIVDKAVEQMKKERSRLIKELNEIDGVRAFDSQANFVLFHTKFKSAEIFKALLKQGVLIRNFGDVPRLNGCLRATVGLPEMNDKLIDGLKCIFER